MLLIGAIAIAWACYKLGLYEGKCKAEEDAKRFTLVITMKLDATQPVTINAVGKDSEGNTVNLQNTDLTLTVENAQGNFGEINDANDTFNPGEAGATGTIKGSVTIDGQEYTASVDVELEAGALSSLDLEFKPTE